jgi:hypothetical protein
VYDTDYSVGAGSPEIDVAVMMRQIHYGIRLRHDEPLVGTFSGG